MQGGKSKEKVEKSWAIEDWLRKHKLLYTAATKHPFILSIRDGTVDFNNFKTWLGQDYIFVRAFVPFVASVLIKACKESDDDTDMEVILGAMASLNGEIEWFKKEASKWGIELSGIAPKKENHNYCRTLENLMTSEVDYAVAITALWAIEAVYQKCFAHCIDDGSKTPAELKETCERWGNVEFREYCDTLQKIANRCLDKASDDILLKAETTLMSILELEVEFWNMSRLDH